MATVVRFMTGNVSGGPLSARDVPYPTRREAVKAIRDADYKPGHKVENGVRVAWPKQK